MRSAHFEPHFAVPPAQETEHVPFVHAWPDGQMLPQLPQLVESVAVSTHLVPHLVVPPEH